ncbi:MAG: hypothetical protein ABEJ31_12630 [Haloarculaceae archaeon]
MRNRMLFGIALVALVGLAGCNGLLGGSGQSASDGGPAVGPDNATAMMDAHQAALEDAGRFHYVRNSTLTPLDGGQLRNYANVSATVDLGSGAYRNHQSVSLQPQVDVYATGNGSAYARLAVGNGSRFAELGPESVNATRYARPPIASFVRAMNFTDEGTSTVDGRTVHTYSVDGADQLDPAVGNLTGVAPENASAVSGCLRLADGGVVRSFDYHVTGDSSRGQRIRYDLSIRYSEVGAAQVSPPSWLPAARQSTAARGNATASGGA